jgi:hypothetical protein
VADFDDLPVASEPDPIESDDHLVLRAEILRLRESLLAANGRTEVLRDHISELEQREEQLALDNAVLHAELGRNPVLRVARAVRSRLPGRS